MESNEKSPSISDNKLFGHLLLSWILVFLCVYFLSSTGQGAPNFNEPMGVRYIHVLLSLISFSIFVTCYAPVYKYGESFLQRLDKYLTLQMILSTAFVSPIFMLLYPVLLLGLFFSILFNYDYELILSPLFYIPYDYQWEKLENIRGYNHQNDTSSLYYGIFCLLVFFLSIPYWSKLRKMVVENKQNNQ